MTYDHYSDWLRQSNSAAVFRQAFELSDQMGAEVRAAVVKAIHRQSEIAWNEIKRGPAGETGQVGWMGGEHDR